MKILIDLDQTILQTSKTLIANWNKLNPNNKLEYKEPVEWDFVIYGIVMKFAIEKILITM